MDIQDTVGMNERAKTYSHAMSGTFQVASPDQLEPNPPVVLAHTALCQVAAWNWFNAAYSCWIMIRVSNEGLVDTGVSMGRGCGEAWMRGACRAAACRNPSNAITCLA